MTLEQFRKWLETSQGYDFEGDNLWMEDYLGEHKWRDIYELFIKFTSDNNGYAVPPTASPKSDKSDFAQS